MARAEKKVSVATARSLVPTTLSAVPFMRVALCLLLLLFFPSLNNDGRNKRRPVDDKYSHARASPSLSARYLDREYGYVYQTCEIPRQKAIQ